MLKPVKDLLQELVQIPSVNPAFSRADRPGCGESEMTDFLQNFSENRGWPWLRQVVHHGRDNLVMVCRASGSANRRQPILWEVHQDTVGVSGMKIDPFAAVESEGRIWGRGACDVKGGMAAMLTALARIEAEGTALRQTIVLALTVNEECGFTGVKALCRLWMTDAAGQTMARQVPDAAGATDPWSSPGQGDGDPDATAAAETLSGPLSLADFRGLRPGYAIVAEPTMLDVVVAHKGSLRWRCHTRGKAAHTSVPERGRNAIAAMVHVVQAIEQYQEDVLSRREAHRSCGGPTVCVSTIQGGAGVNTVPDHTVIDIDRRLVPGEAPLSAYQELVDYIAARTVGKEVTIEHEPPTNQSVGLEDANNRVWAKQVAATVDSSNTGWSCQSSQLIGVPYGTDAWALAAAGIPTVVFGPGSIDQAHTDDEWIDVEQLDRATEVFYRIAVGGE